MDRAPPPDPSRPERDSDSAVKSRQDSGSARERALRKRVILGVAIVCGAVWLSALYDILRDRTAALAMAQRQHDNVAGALAEQAARTLQATDLILQQAALLDPGRPGATVTDAEVPQLLRRHCSGVPQVRNLFIYDPARHLHLTTAQPGNAYTELSDRSYFIAQRERSGAGLYISEPMVSRVTGTPTFVLSRSLPGAEFHGIVGAAVDVGYFRKFYRALDLGSNSTVDLIRDDGLVLVSREREHVESSPSPWLAALRDLGTQDAVHSIADQPGLGRALIAVRRVPGYPALIALARPEHDVLAGWRHEFWTSLARTLVITALAGALLVAFLRQLDRHDRVKARLHQSQKLEALGTLAGGIAHDFNNVLGAVLGYGELAVQHSEPGTALRRYADNIVVAANRARNLVARILAFSRPGVGVREPVVVQDILTEIRSLAGAALPEHVRIELRMPNPPLVVAGDAAQLHQMIYNLVANAVQAVGREGEVVISAESIAVDAERELTVGHVRPGQYARVAVTDSGTGIPSDQVERIFDPFFTTKPVGEGTGLGLSLVHGIVLDHAAALDVDSRVGRGTVFSVYLPLADAKPGRVELPEDLPLGSGETVLVVDDEVALVRLAEEVLASLGYEPVGCVGAAEALATFRAEPGRFDALLTDVIMPDMSGTDLANALTRQRPDLPVIFMSGYAGPSRATQTAGYECLVKPLRAAELARCMAQTFAGARIQPPAAAHRA
jgi:signal transduction histidine kinase/ActR/RegA family two-component response regulator